MIWRLSHRADPPAVAIADRHYNRQKPGSAQFLPPGRCVVLLAPGPGLWGPSYPQAEYVKHAWAGAWVCSIFRREGGDLPASEMIRQAVAATRWHYGEPPELGMVTFIDRRKVTPYRRRGQPPIWGRSYMLAGFKPVGKTKGELLAFQLAPEDMPAPLAPLPFQPAEVLRAPVRQQALFGRAA